jgi:hypothetical protein
VKRLAVGKLWEDTDPMFDMTRTRDRDWVMVLIRHIITSASRPQQIRGDSIPSGRLNGDESMIMAVICVSFPFFPLEASF